MCLRNVIKALLAGSFVRLIAASYEMSRRRQVFPDFPPKGEKISAALAK
jgi:hypothetical protein